MARKWEGIFYTRVTVTCGNVMFSDARHAYGRLASRTWARGVSTAYAYDGFGLLVSMDYSDATPGASLTHYQLRAYSPSMGRFISRDPIWESGGLNLYGFCENESINMVDILGLDKKCYRWMLISFYTGQKPTKRNSWNKADLTEMDAAVGLTNYEHDPKTTRSKRTSDSKGRDSYAYPPGTEFTIYRGKTGKDRRTVRDGGSEWAYERPGAPSGVGVDEWLDLWTKTDEAARKKGIEVDLVSTEVKDDCPCPEGWSSDEHPEMPEHLKKIKDAIPGKK